MNKNIETKTYYKVSMKWDKGVWCACNTEKEAREMFQDDPSNNEFYVIEPFELTEDEFADLPEFDEF